MIRKYISIGILFIILFNIGGYYMWFGVMQYRIRKEIKQEIRKGLNDNDLILFEISDNSKTDLNWIEAGKEFSFNAEMYDVVKEKKLKNKTLYYCINDRKEEQLIANYKETHNTKKETDKKLRIITPFQYFQSHFETRNYKHAISISYPNLIFLYTSNIPDVHSPPPKNT